MTAEEKTIRVGLSSREAFDRWASGVEVILAPDADDMPGWDVAPPLVTDHSEWPLCQWAVGQWETGRVVFRDAGESSAEMTVEVDHSDPDVERLSRRLESILRRYGGLIVEGAHVIDPPAQTEDPLADVPPDEHTEKDQPL